MSCHPVGRGQAPGWQPPAGEHAARHPVRPGPRTAAPVQDASAASRLRGAARAAPGCGPRRCAARRRRSSRPGPTGKPRRAGRQHAGDHVREPGLRRPGRRRPGRVEHRLRRAVPPLRGAIAHRQHDQRARAGRGQLRPERRGGQVDRGLAAVQELLPARELAAGRPDARPGYVRGGRTVRTCGSRARRAAVPARSSATPVRSGPGQARADDPQCHGDLHFPRGFAVACVPVATHPRPPPLFPGKRPQARPGSSGRESPAGIIVGGPGPAAACAAARPRPGSRRPGTGTLTHVSPACCHGRG